MSFREEKILKELQLGKKTRLSDLLAGTFSSIPSRKGFKKAIDKGLVFVNGNPAQTATPVENGDVIAIKREEVKRPENVRLNYSVIFEDEHFAIVNKPAGILVSGNRKWTLENSFKSRLSASSEEDFLEFPEPIHRLDYPTTGALLVGKTISSVIALNAMFEKREIEKEYLAVCIGEISKPKLLEDVIEGKNCKAELTPIKTVKSPRFGHLSLVKLKPETGRKHQLRIQLKNQNTPILGDNKYFIEGLVLNGKGLYLHSLSLAFAHPKKDVQMKMQASVPKKFQKIFPISVFT